VSQARQAVPLRLLDRQHLTHRTSRRNVQIRTRCGTYQVLEPDIERDARGSKALKCGAEGQAFDVDDQQRALARRLQRPHFLLDAQTLFGSGVVTLPLAFQLLQEGTGGFLLTSEDG